MVIKDLRFIFSPELLTEWTKQLAFDRGNHQATEACELELNLSNTKILA